MSPVAFVGVIQNLGLNHDGVITSHGHVSHGLQEENPLPHSMGIIPTVYVNELFGNVAQTPWECFLP